MAYTADENKHIFTEEVVSPETIEYQVEELDLTDLPDLSEENGSEAAEIPFPAAAASENIASETPVSYPVEDIGSDTPVSYPVEDIGSDLKTEEAAPRHSRKRHSALKAIAVIAGVLVLGAAGAYAYGVDYYKTRFLPGTFIDGVLVENLTPEEAEAKITMRHASVDHLFTVNGKEGSSETVDLSTAGLFRSYTGLDNVIATQNRMAFLPEKNIFKYPAGGYSVVIGDPAAFDSAVLSMQMADPEKTREPVDAFVTFDEATETYAVVPEQQGTAIIPEVFVKEIKDAVQSGAHSFTFTAEDPEGVYKKPVILSDNEGLTNYVTKMNSLKDIHAKVDMGAGTLVEVPTAEIRKMLVKGLITPEGGMPAAEVSHAIDKEVFDKYLFRLDGQYTTKSPAGARYFVSITGKKELVNTDYGWEMDKEATGVQLFTMLDEAVRKAVVDPGTAEQCPAHQISAVWKQEAVSHETANDVGNTWVEVDIANQKVYLVEDGVQILDSPVVTGMDVVKGRRTPTGIYKVSFKSTNRDLVGYNSDGTEAYRSHVNYWMPFNKNVGLHDATWRGSFGGEIYVRSGSHGCVNMPLAKAKELYQHVYKGMPVIVYAGTKEAR